jgi:ABC-2 type transport system permease protein
LRLRHALEIVGLLAALVAFMKGYLFIAQAFGVTLLDAVEAYQIEGWPAYAVLLLFVVWAPLVEEVVFRGFVQSRFERVTTPGSALMAQAALFSAAHAVPGSLVSHALIGLTLGFLRNRSGGLYAPILLHAGYNAWVVLSELGHLPEPFVLQ